MKPIQHLLIKQHAAVAAGGTLSADELIAKVGVAGLLAEIGVELESGVTLRLWKKEFNSALGKRENTKDYNDKIIR